LTESADSTDKKAFTGIEIGRFLCALAVILWHYQQFFQPGLESGSSELPADIVKYPFYSVLSFFYLNGHHAVVIFWMLSGFTALSPASGHADPRRGSADSLFVLA
jgi:peptidoglycan/LPS O-acetylase OafA/YrhL